MENAQTDALVGVYTNTTLQLHRGAIMLRYKVYLWILYLRVLLYSP